MLLRHIVMRTEGREQDEVSLSVFPKRRYDGPGHELASRRGRCD